MRTALIVLFASLLVGCAALEAVTPVSQAEVNEMAEAQAKDMQAAVEAAESGDPLGAALGSLGVLASGALLYYSRKRRAPEIAAAVIKKAGGKAELPPKA